MIKIGLTPKVMAVLSEVINKNTNKIKPGYTADDLITRIQNGSQNNGIKVFYNEDNDIINGLLIAEIVNPFSAINVVFIWLCWIDKNQPELHNKFMAEAERYGKEWGATKIQIMVAERENVWKKKYGFFQESIIMSKQLKKE